MKTAYVSFFSRTTSGKVKVWSCWIEPDGVTVTSRWGLKDGKQQTTSDRIKAIGKKPATVAATEEHARQVKKKLRAGYVAAEAKAASVRLQELKTGLDFDRLPRAFAPAKPVREVDPAMATDWDKRGLLAIQRKRDGMRHYIVAGNHKDGQLRVYSRGMDDMSAHFERLTNELRLPPGTVLDAEFVVTSPKGDDDFTAVSEICRSKAERAGYTMVSYERNGYDIRFMIFDLLFYDKLPTWQLPYRERREALVRALELAHADNHRTKFQHVVPMQQLTCSLAKATTLVKEHEWEGLVLWRQDQATQVHLNRSPKRCNCYKYKPMREDDFIAVGFELGNGRNSKVVGALNLALYVPRRPRVRKKLVSMGNVGTGFDDRTRTLAMQWEYPCVVQVRYEKMTKTGLRFPSFLRKRDDKKPKECTL